MGAKKNKISLANQLFFLSIILCFIGLLFIFEASSVRSFQQYGDSLYYLKLQLVWIILGIGMMIFFSFFDYHRLYFFSFMLMFVNIILLFLVLIPGIGQSAGGARRWLSLGIFNLQPTEMAKLSTIIYLSSWFLYRERKRFFSFLLLLGILFLLIILQPDMGSAIIIFFLSILIYFFAGNSLFYLLFLIPFSFIFFYILIHTSPYRLQRFLAYINPSSDPLGISYHINQIFISLANGGLFGFGIGGSRQKYLYLPEAHTDSIFAIIAEEFGFIGSMAIIMLYCYLTYLLYKITITAKDRFGFLLSSAILSLFLLQIIVNLGGIVNLIPLTGVPLPLISYGGSNLIVSLSLIGIAINIARQGKTQIISKIKL
jgi:cell division protein FtsW